MIHPPPEDLARYAPRPVAVLPAVSIDGWKLKPYRVLGREADRDAPLDEPAIDAILTELPEDAQAPGRPGLGFIIEHLATPLDYLVLAWWQNKNEMITRIFIREAGAPWRLSTGGESFCVWDLDIMWFERNAFIRTMLAFEHADPAAYLAARFEKAHVG
ncbi:MAG: hypothetical protein KF805_14145 [Phycisphaeraceae bacterium]|nr:hypothetical protein [Phycisphaeraceae bacterium]